MAVFSIYDPDNLWYKRIDYLCGVTLIILAVSSLLLNPTVFLYYNRRETASLWTILYQMLALSDMLTLLYYPYLLAHEFFSEDLLRVRVLQKVTLAGSFVEFVTLNVSAFIVTVLCFTRYISVKHPFIIIKRRVVIISVICYTMFCLVVLGCRMVIVHGQPCGMDESKTCPIEFIYIGEKEYELREVEHVLRIIAMATLPLCGTISFIFSILTILALKQSDSISTTGRTRTVTKKSCITIGIINFFNVLYCIVVLICVSMMERYAKADGTDQAKYRREGFMVSSFYFLGMRLFPMCLSALNPLIILVRCKEMRDTLREGVKKMCHCKGEDTVHVPPSRLSHPTFRHTVA